MRHIAIALFSLTLAAALAGCDALWFPHHVRTQPEIDGVLLSGGAPRAGVAISACQGAPEGGVELAPRRCDGVAWATTDAQGRFHFESHQRTDVALLTNAPTYAILAVTSHGRELVWHRDYRDEAPAREMLRCELGDRLVCTSAP